MTNKNPGPWKVTCNPVAGKKLYGVYRLRDKDAVDHSGNRETRGGYYENRIDAEKLAALLNKEDER